jgi:hypothetical protein
VPGTVIKKFRNDMTAETPNASPREPSKFSHALHIVGSIIAKPVTVHIEKADR